ncbi:MAG: HupE/UreJ family protein [Parahaliea sp.]
MRLAPRWAAGLLAAWSQLALAHSPIEGIGKFYGGLLHPILVLPHAIALCAFALLVGQDGLRAMRGAYPPFMLLLALGLGLAGFEVAPALPASTLLLSAALLCGLLVVLQWPLPGWLLSALGGTLGLVVGMDSGVADLNRQETFGALLGCWLGAVIALIVIAGVVELLQRPWQKIAVRVLASWICASAMMALALALR